MARKNTKEHIGDENERSDRVVENRQTLETIRISTEYSALESMTSGVTLCNDILEAPFAEQRESNSM